MMSSAPVAAERGAPGRLLGRAGASQRAAAAGLFSVLLSSTYGARAEAPDPVEPAESPRAVATLSVGRGLRLNNPYRLATPLGDSAESLSLSATYLDLGLGMLFADDGFHHGPSLSGALALQGIGQLVLTPSYLGELEVGRAWVLRGRLGLPLVVTPDTTVGMEAAVGSRLGVAYGLGLIAELVGSVFFGAATEERSVTTIPVIALQVGVCFEHAVPW